MNRRTALLAPPALLALSLVALAVPAAAQPLPLAELSAYLNGIRTAEADFTQTGEDGTQSTGRLFIHRPNRMRFEYAPPDRTVVLASAGQVAIFDARSNVDPEQYPLKRTPLNLILASTVDLGRARMVTGHSQSGDMTVVTAQDPDNPEYGSIALYFSADPIALREWVVTDEYGSMTRVVLGDLVTGRDYPPSTFSIDSEMKRRN